MLPLVSGIICRQIKPSGRDRVTTVKQAWQAGLDKLNKLLLIPGIS
jgi:hypothetical protein